MSKKVNSLTVTTYGTRGSMPVAGPEFVRYYGNTTSVRIESQCIPPNSAYCIDAGSGFIQLVKKALAEGILYYNIRYTHYHYDHIMGILMAGSTYNPNCRMHLAGPVDQGMGPQKMMEGLMCKSFWPVVFDEVRHRFTCKDLALPKTLVEIIHPEGGYKYFQLHEYQAILAKGNFIPFCKGRHFPIEECLVVKMFRNNHPEQTISYRIEENPTGKVLVFHTDHENDGFPGDLIAHVRNADLLILDCQYTPEEYKLFGAGRGHATPDYCVELAKQGNVKCLGLTHHDNNHTDDQIDNIVDMAQQMIGQEIKVFGCRDFEVTTLV